MARGEEPTGPAGGPPCWCAGEVLTYLRARVRGDATYRLSGNVATNPDLIVSTRNGDMHQGRTGVAGDLDRSELPIDAQGNFSILVGPDVREGQGIRTMPDVDHLSIRQDFIDWESESPAEFHVERISPGPALPVPLELETVETRLDRAA